MFTENFSFLSLIYNMCHKENHLRGGQKKGPTNNKIKERSTPILLIKIFQIIKFMLKTWCYKKFNKKYFKNGLKFPNLKGLGEL